MRHVVGVADLKISDNNVDEIVTYALGSCLGVTAYDPVARVGGMLHVMLPSSAIAPDKAAANPCMFVDSGIPKLFLDCCRAGAVKQRLVVKAAGGACVIGSQDDYFQIGRRNYQMLAEILARHGVPLMAVDVAGNNARTLILEIATGAVRVCTHSSISIL